MHWLETHWRILIGILIAFGAINWFLYEREIAHPPGILINQMPQVSDTLRSPWVDGDGLRYQPVARLEISARLLSRNNVSLGSWDHISPVDLGLGWGAMSDSAILDQLDIAQYNAPLGGSRFLAFNIRDDAEIRHWTRKRRAELFRQLTHVHAIPASSEIAEQLKHMRPGLLIKLDGLLVNVTDPQGRALLKTSTILGDHDCEIMWVRSIIEIP